MIPILIAVAVVAFFAFIVLRGRRGDITPDQARALLDKGGILVDVRTAGEFSAGHLPNAINAPLQQLGNHLKQLKKKAKKGPVIVYCLSGSRSASAQRILQQEAFSEVRNLGAMSRW